MFLKTYEKFGLPDPSSTGGFILPHYFVWICNCDFTYYVAKLSEYDPAVRLTLNQMKVFLLATSACVKGRNIDNDGGLAAKYAKYVTPDTKKWFDVSLAESLLRESTCWGEIVDLIKDFAMFFFSLQAIDLLDSLPP